MLTAVKISDISRISRQQFTVVINLLLVYCRQQALFHVLGAYSMYNTEVGYCQGMSQIAALLLMYLNEEVSLLLHVLK